MSSIMYTARCALKTNEEIEICSAYKNIQPFTKQLTKGFCRYTALSLRPFYFVHTCGVRVVFGDHRALGICKSLVCTESHGPLSLRFRHSHAVQIFLVSDLEMMRESQFLVRAAASCRSTLNPVRMFTPAIKSIGSLCSMYNHAR